MSKNSARTDPATKEVLRYGEALWDGYSELKKRGLLSTNLFVELVQIIKEDTACIRKLPGTVIQNARTGATVFTPPAGESVIREKLKSLEEYTHADNGTNPLITLAVIHCQCEAVHPFSDGNGRRGRILTLFGVEGSPGYTSTISLPSVRPAEVRRPVQHLSSFLLKTQ